MGHTTSTHAIALEQRTPTASPVHFKNRGASLGLKATQPDQLVDRIEGGFPYRALEHFADVSGIPIAQIAGTMGIPPRTLARRRITGKFGMFESERLLRVSTLFEKAVELFEGNVAAAAAWLSSPKKALGNHVPLSYARTEVGAREVENLIGRLEHGVFT